MADSLYCPRCGNSFASNTSYCRVCGLSLDGVNAIVSGEAGNAPDVRTRPNYTSMRLGAGLFIVGTALGLGMSIVKELDLWGLIYLKVIFLSFLISGLLFLGSSFVFPKKYFVKKGSARSGDGVELDRGLVTDQLGQLPSADGTIADVLSVENVSTAGSVTEHTTRQLR